MDRYGDRLTRDYDVTIQRYRKSRKKIKDGKMQVLWGMGSIFREVSMVPFEIPHKIGAHTPQNIHFTRCQNEL